MRALALALFFPAAAFAAQPYGILLMAHGGDASWNAEVDRLRENVNAKVPTEIALGMGDAGALQNAIDRLERRDVTRIVAVPLFVQTNSEVLDQTRYVLGLSEKPSEVMRAAFARLPHGHAHGHGHAFSSERVKARVPLTMSAALDDHPLVARILLERARSLSRDPGRESVVIVAHGPVDDAALPAWRKTMSALATQVRAEGKFKAVSYGMLRDDAAPAVRAAAVADLRAGVFAAGQMGRALVIPLLIARGGIERKIPRDLVGLRYCWNGQALMPHAGFTRWVLARAADAATGGR